MNKKYYLKHIEDTIKSFSSIQTEIDSNILKKFIDHKRVIFCTMGKSAFAWRKVVYTARYYGLEWHGLDVCHAFHGDAGIIKQNDLLVFVSKSGNTKETVEVANYFSSWQTIGVCSDAESRLANICENNIIISVNDEGSPFGFAPMISTTLYLVVLHAILCETIDASKCSLEEYARNHPAGDIGKRLKNVDNS